MVYTAEDKQVNKSAPWHIFYERIGAMFGEDEDIEIQVDDPHKTVKLYVKGTDKAEALNELLPSEKVFGNITVKLLVIPANDENPSKKELFEMGFAGNPAFAFAAEGARGESTSIPFTYIAFNDCVVQYYADNLEDYYGNESTLLQEIAKDIFVEHPGVKFCTRGRTRYSFSKSCACDF